MWTTPVATLWRTLDRPAGWARRQLSHWGAQTLNLLYPPHCAYCDAYPLGAEQRLLLCEKCIALLAPVVWEACRRCGAEISEHAPIARNCPHCLGQRFHFDAVVALGPYRRDLREAVLRMKHPNGEALATVMGQLHALRRGGLWAEPIRPDLVVPVPMHWRRQFTRKANGVERLAAAIACAFELPLETRALYQHRNTRLQRNLAPAERFRNIHDAFRIRRGYDLRQTSVLLVDDVLTTGATASEAAKVLKRDGGVTRVTVAVLARSTGEDGK